VRRATVGMALLCAALGAGAESQVTHQPVSVTARVTFAVVVAPVLSFDCAIPHTVSWTHANERWRNKCVRSMTTSRQGASLPEVVTLSWP
jgi:hypothetical protein